MATVIGQVSSLGYVQPVGSLVGLAGVNVHQVLAVFALHSAAPLELALALGDTFDTHGVIAPPTAHDLTAVCASRGLVAHSACCAQGACKEIYIFVLQRKSFPKHNEMSHLVLRGSSTQQCCCISSALYQHTIKDKHF